MINVIVELISIFFFKNLKFQIWNLNFYERKTRRYLHNKHLKKVGLKIFVEVQLIPKFHNFILKLFNLF